MKASEAVEMTMEAIATKSNKLKTVRANYPVKFTHEDIIHIAACMDYVQKEKDKHYASLTKKEN